MTTKYDILSSGEFHDKWFLLVYLKKSYLDSYSFPNQFITYSNNEYLFSSHTACFYKKKD